MDDDKYIPYSSSSSEDNDDDDENPAHFPIAYYIIAGFIIISIILGATNNPSPEFQVKHLSISSLQLSACEISAHWNISILVKNPRRGVNIFYDMIRVFLLYEKEFLSEADADIKSLYQGAGHQITLNANPGVKALPVKVNPWVVSAIETDKKLRKQVLLNVVLDARITKKPESICPSRFWMKVFCENIKLQFLSKTNQFINVRSSGGRAGRCRVKLWKDV